MVARNISWSLAHVPRDGMPSTHEVAQQIETYFATHPEISWENFLLSALQRELDVRNWNHQSCKRLLACVLNSESSELTASRPSFTVSDVRLHAMLAARVVALNRPKHGRWLTIPQVLLRNPFCRLVQTCLRMK